MTRDAAKRRVRLLADVLEACRERYAGVPLPPDPVAFPHRYPDARDAEAAAFIAASFAFGGALQITRFLDRLFAVLGPSPYAALRAGDPRSLSRVAGMRHHFISPGGVHRFLFSLRAAYRAHGTLEALFRDCADEGDGGIRTALARFLRSFRDAWGEDLPRERNFLFPDPLRGAAAKRHNLFLRWVVRGPDGVDLGLWKSVDPAVLVVPLDTHMGRLARALGLTDRTASDWRTAEEITASFRAVCPDDPVRYDFALTRIGILKECGRAGAGRCDGCVLSPLCRDNRG